MRNTFLWSLALLIAGIAIGSTLIAEPGPTAKTPPRGPATTSATTTQAATAAATSVATAETFANEGGTVNLELNWATSRFVLKVLRTVSEQDGKFAAGGMSGLASDQAVLVIKGKLSRAKDVVTIEATEGIFEYGPEGTTRTFKLSDEGKTLTSDKGLILRRK